MPLGHVGVQILERKRCLALLETVPLGRVGFTSGALPVILPVNFALLDGDIVFRTVAGSKLEAALRRQVACFEADGFDGVYHTGWSVLVTGETRVLTDPKELADAERLPLPSWVRSPAPERFVRLSADLVAGRWLRTAHCPDDLDGYGTDGYGTDGLGPGFDRYEAADLAPTSVR